MNRQHISSRFIVSLVLVTLGAVALAAESNCMPNPSFETVDQGKPADWQKTGWSGGGEQALADGGRSGGRSVVISSVKGGDIAWQAIVPVKPFSIYRLTGWIKTENVKPTDNLPGRGAQLNIHNLQSVRTQAVKGTQDWTQVEARFETMDNDSVAINCLFGGWGQCTGKAWFDDISLVLLSSRDLKPNIKIFAEKTGEPMSPYIYSQFIEHLGRCIYGGIWAEMLEDRKFWYAVGEDASPWRIVGPAKAVTMNTAVSLAGKHCPAVSLDKEGEAAGIMQKGLALLEGKEYVGRVVLAGMPSAGPVYITLSWGDKAVQKKTITIPRIVEGYQKYPFTFLAQLTTDNAELSITGTGRGAFAIGAVSLMPADNIYGMRPDTLKLLKELNAPLYRWPGGNFVSGYNWTDGIGDPDVRPPRKNPAWKGVEHNDFGIHEFIRFCRILKTEPLVVVNTGLGKVDNAVQELMYANSSTETALGQMRAMNGDPEPFDVVWWGIGNEMYGGWQLGHMPLADYIKKNNLFVDAMRAVSPAIKVVAVGATGRWSEGMMAQCADHMDLISEHFYCQTRPGVASHVNQIPNAIRNKAETHRRYRKTIKALEGKDIRIAMDEWNYWYGPHVYGELGTRYFLKDALGIAAGINEFSKHTDIITMANYAQTVNVIGCIKTTKTAAAFATTGLVLKMYRHHFGCIPVEVTGENGLLDIAAAWSEDKKTLTISLVNPMAEAVAVPFEIVGQRISGTGHKLTVTGPDAMAYNEPGKPPRVTVVKETCQGVVARFDVPPLSAVIYKMTVSE